MLDFEKMKVLQKNLDERKYLESINNNRDMSGHMPYCKKCAVCSSNGCNINQAIREDLKQCSRAYLLTNECDRKFYEVDTIMIKSSIGTNDNQPQKNKTQKGKKNA